MKIFVAIPKKFRPSPKKRKAKPTELWGEELQSIIITIRRSAIDAYLFEEMDTYYFRKLKGQRRIDWHQMFGTWPLL